MVASPKRSSSIWTSPSTTCAAAAPGLAAAIAWAALQAGAIAGVIALGERLAVNSVMQGTAADIIKVAMIRIHDRLREEGRGARLVLQVHDELLLEAPETETSAVKELVREEMCRAYDLDPPLAVDIGVGDDWHEAKS